MIRKDNYGWDEDADERLRSLALKGTMFYTEIAEKLGRSSRVVRWRAKKLGLPSTQKTLKERFGEWNAKHSHLREPVMRYFMTHNWEQTCKKFGLTHSELKSLFSTGYRMVEFKHLRKETRDHSAWSTKQLKFLLRHAGLRPRKWIAEKIGRGNAVCIKERMQTLGVSSRTLQGITLSQFRKAFGQEPRFYLKTDVGPDGGVKGTLPTRWKIIPWIWLDQEIKTKRLKTSKEFKMIISARAQFQEWIFEGNALSKMKRIVRDAK